MSLFEKSFCKKNYDLRILFVSLKVVFSPGTLHFSAEKMGQIGSSEMPQ